MDGKSSFKFKIIIFKNTKSMAIPTWAYSNLHAIFFSLLRLCLFQCKIFSGCKIFLVENIFKKRKYFLVFGCIVKIILENNFQCLVIFWKCYFPTNFSHFLSHFLNFQTNFISQNPPPHNTETTKTPPPTPLPKKKSEIKEIK